jgi:hypothetical protein
MVRHIHQRHPPRNRPSTHRRPIRTSRPLHSKRPKLPAIPQRAGRPRRTDAACLAQLWVDDVGWSGASSGETGSACVNVSSYAIADRGLLLLPTRTISPLSFALTLFPRLCQHNMLSLPAQGFAR